jgi:hypothetical protein
MKQRISFAGTSYPPTNNGITSRGVFVLFLVIAGVFSLITAACELSETSVTYTVAYDKNNGSATGVMENQTFTYGVTQKFTACNFSSPYHAFTGWNTKADGSGTMFFNSANGSKVTQAQNETVTLYAQWSLNTSTLNTWVHKNENVGTETNPLEVGVTRQLTAANWNAILSVLGTTKYISLDLSTCTRSGDSGGNGLRADGVFAPGTTSARIVNITLPAVATGISANAFQGYTALKSITLGATPPKLEANICSGLSARTITVRIPESALEAYGVYTIQKEVDSGGGTTIKKEVVFDNAASSANNWGNGFRGWGWGGTASQSGSVNTNITLKFETY